jgi:glucose-1-phosphatase
MTISAVIFDFGGVLVRTEDQTPRMRLAEKLGIHPGELYRVVFDSETAIQATLGQISTEDHLKSVQTSLNLDPQAVSASMEAFWAGDILDEQLIAFIRSLKPRFKTGLLSNAWDELRGRLVDTWKIDTAFDDIVISSEVGIAKPDPAIYSLAAERLGVRPEQAVFVDDMPENVETARAAGLEAVRFIYREQTIAELQALLELK